jgi:hypothetical protein
MVGNSPVSIMDELPFKIVKMLREFVDLQGGGMDSLIIRSQSRVVLSGNAKQD